MDAQSAGSMLIMTGVVLVLIAGYRLRAPQSSEAQNREDRAPETEAEEKMPRIGKILRANPHGNPVWVWVGRLGSFMALVGGMLLILDYYRHGA
ncbi:MAG: hypothetical protein IJM72_08030 [Deltaproteobacteria bacterium]|nr:hypothetical protein [Deltaproteobacteria bacterium]